MDKERAATIAAVAARGEQIKTNSAEYLWVCRGVKLPRCRTSWSLPIPMSIQVQLPLLNRRATATRQSP